MEPVIDVIDLKFCGQPHGVATYLIDYGDEAALIDVGPTSTVKNLLEHLEKRGLAGERIRHIFLTHIHLDHAGALGGLLARFPCAQAYVHPAGAPHLIDPSRLVNSAQRLYGDAMDRLWGEMVPVAPERLRVLNDGERVQIAGHTLVAIETLGHARHHHSYWEESTGTLFTGDIGGVRMPGAAYVRPPTPPPDLDVEQWRASLRKLRQFEVQFIAITHFGLYDDVGRHLDDLEKRLVAWAEFTRPLVEKGISGDELVTAIREHAEAEMRSLGVPADSYDLGVSYELVARGYERYWRKKLGLA